MRNPMQTGAAMLQTKSILRIIAFASKQKSVFSKKQNEQTTLLEHCAKIFPSIKPEKINIFFGDSTFIVESQLSKRARLLVASFFTVYSTKMKNRFRALPKEESTLKEPNTTPNKYKNVLINDKASDL